MKENVMRKKVMNYVGFLPGLLVALAVAGAAVFIESLLPIHIIGGSVIALFIGMILNIFLGKYKILKSGLKFTSKKILKFAIILLGASLSVGTILSVGKMSLTVMLFTLFTCFGVGFVVGKLLGLNWKLSNLISAGTGICGGSAIAAIAPVIDAEDKDIAYAMSATFIFDMIMILLFPIFGHMLGLSDTAYGLWAGTAVNDTSSVVAAGYAFSEGGGDFAAMVKMTRTLAIIPTVLIFAMINVHLKRKEAKAQAIANPEAGQVATKKISFVSLFPWFIVGFLALAMVNSFGVIPVSVAAGAKTLSKFLMVAALAAIGLGTNLSDMKKSGARPMLHGFIISALVVVVAISVEYCMGIV